WSWRKFAAFAGPGWLMSLAYLDPGNLESDLQLGAYTRYSLLWVLFWATAGGLLLQEMAARLGVVTGETLAKCVKRAYGPRVSLLLYGAAELAIVGSDVQEVLGTATGLRILFGLPLWAGCVVTAIDTCTFFLVQRLGWRALEAAIGALVVTLAVAFIGVWAAAPSEPGPLLYGLAVPTMRPSMLTQAVGTVGAVVMPHTAPHNLYLHSGLVRSAVADRTRAARVRDALRYTLADSALSLLLSFVVNMAVVAAFAAFFWSAACGDETACVPDAAGDGTPGAAGAVIFGVGLLAAGQASTTAATIAGQYVMEGFFDWDVARWKRVALSRFLALGPAVLVAVSPMGQRNSFNEMLNVLQSACLPFAMLPLLHLARDERLMGRFANGPRLNRVVTTASVVVLAVNLILVYQY
ncbi:hypothetical protein AURANDRAFT_1822, partial [Aureococcus anophagefferens]